MFRQKAPPVPVPDPEPAPSPAVPDPVSSEEGCMGASCMCECGYEWGTGVGFRVAVCRGGRDCECFCGTAVFPAPFPLPNPTPLPENPYSSLNPCSRALACSAASQDCAMNPSNLRHSSTRATDSACLLEFERALARDKRWVVPATKHTC